MIRKLLAAAVALAAFASTAHADSGPPAGAKPATAPEVSTSIANAQTEGVSMRRPAHPPTAIRVSLPASAEITPDRFRAIVMFGGSGTNRAELEKNADEALASVQKAVARVPGVKATPGVRQHRDMRCSSNGVCVAVASMPSFHSELELTSDNRQALAKALAEAQKATDKASMSATPIQAGVSDAATDKALRTAMVNGRRAAEAAAAALAKDGERWHIAEIRFDQNCTPNQPPVPAGLPPAPAEMPAFAPPAGSTCSNSPEIELRASTTILIFPPPKP